MGRNRRMWNPDVFEHVTMRGNNRQNIFHNQADYHAFFRILDYTYQKYPFTIISYCLMTNHYHLLIQSPEVPTGKLMAMINRRYSDYHKKKYTYYGSMFEGRYFSDKVVTPKSFLSVSRYIHRNPINTKMSMVEKMELYPYSSYSFYINDIPPFYEFINLKQLFLYLPSPYSKTAEGYRLYCESEDDGEEP